MGRAPCCDKANVKRGPWSPEEDATLRTYIQNYGTGGNWIALPTKAGLRRCGKSCRLRWLNYLRPGIKHGGFTEEEDKIIYTLYSQMGSRWSVIASQLNGRTDNDVKNYWNTKLKKKLLGVKNSITSNNNTSSSIPTENPTLLGSTTSPPSTSNIEDYNLSFSTSLAQNPVPSPVLTNVAGYGLMTVNNQSSFMNDPFQFPCHGLTNIVCEFSSSAILKGHSGGSSSQEANSSVSGSSSLGLELEDKCVSWPSINGNGGGHEDHNGLLMDFGFGIPCDLINGFWCTQEKASEGVPTCPSLVDNSTSYANIKPQGLLQNVINQY